ncbi:MAG: hypothetical protein ACREL7_16485 [Longimicrobiales bacterium]
MRTPLRSSAVPIAGLVAVAILFAGSLARAIAIDAGPVAPSGPPSFVEPTADPPVPAPDVARPLPLEAVRLAADADPFQPDRRRAPRYVLPSERQSGEPDEGPPPAPAFRLMGTAVVGNGGLAVVALEEDDPPRLLQIGDLMEGYRLTRVQPFGATMEGQGRSLDLHVMPPSPNPPVAVESGRARGMQRGRNAAVSERVRAQLLRQFELLRERGASQDVLEEFLERMRDAGVDEIRTDDGRITIDNNGRITVRRGVNRDTLDAPGPRAPRNR